MKTNFGPSKILFPSPVALVVTGTMNEANIATIAWASLLTSKPPTLGISVGQKGFTGEAIKNNMNFSVNIATVEIMTEADFCGITTGKEIDKFERSGLTKMSSNVIESPIIKECPLNLECKLTDWRIIGQTIHFVGEIAETHVDTKLLGDTADLGSIDIAALNPLIYFGGVREYRNIGDKIGDAYQIGKQLRQQI